MTKEIIFTSPLEGIIDPPQPSLLTIPDVYKNLSKKIEGDNPGAFTVKSCMPFLDALTIGYMITFPIDVCFQVLEKKDDKGETVREARVFWHPDVPEEFTKFFDFTTHDQAQMPNGLRTVYRTLDVIYKIINPWHIKTPPGYSCIFTNPFNRNLPFKIIDGIVDTDVFPLIINFPCFWTGDISIKETIIKKGTPLALIIPFKRDEWKMKTINGEINTLVERTKYGSIFKDNYKKLFWNKKSFK